MKLFLSSSVALILLVGATVRAQHIEMRGLLHPDTVGDMGGFNIIKNNNLDHNASSAEIVLADGVTLRFGNELNIGSPTVIYGQNSIIGNTTLDMLVYAAGLDAYIGNASVSSPDNCMNDNYYQVLGSAYVPRGFSPDAQFGGAVINYASTRGTVTTLDSVPSNPGIECYGREAGGGGGGGGDLAKKGGDRTAAVPAPDTASLSECDKIQNAVEKLDGPGTEELAYDTAKAFLTLCYYEPNAWGMFSGASSANGERNNDLNRFVEFREWLKSVLYLRMDTDWYCADVYAMITTFDYFEGQGGYPNGAIAVERYILDNNRCSSEWSSMFAGDTAPEAYGRTEVWRDTVQDSSTEARPDTTIPSIDSIGLSILRGPQYAGIKETPLPEGTDHINDLYVTENPFTNATAIKFTLADYGLVTFQLFDVLGHAVTTNGIGQVLYPGEHEFDIDGSKLSPGNYIARVAFHDGDVESIMVEKK